MKVNLEDIARASGVSKATASYVLNGKQTAIGISEATRGRVRAAAREHGYRPDRNAVALARRRRAKASVILLSPWFRSTSSHFMAEAFGALERMSRRMSVRFEMFTGGRLGGALRRLEGVACDAVLIVGTGAQDDAYLAENRGHARNVVVLNRSLKGYPSASGDDFAGGQRIAEHSLRTATYERHVILTSGNPTQVVARRAEGMLDVLARKADARPHFEVIRNEKKLPLEEQLDRIVERHRRRRTLYLTMQDTVAASTVAHLLRKGIAVPAEAGVTGYDASPIARLMVPSIATVDSRLSEMSTAAAELCLRRPEGRAAASRVFAPRVVPGESVQPKGG